MHKKLKNPILIASSYIGAVIGAGFATGQELLRYFVRFGSSGIIAIMLCGAIFALVGYKVLSFMHLHNLTDYGEFLCCTMGKRLGKATELMGLCFLMVLYASMLSAVQSLFKQWLNIGYGSLITAMLCTLLVCGGVKSLGIFNLILCPLLVGGSIAIGLWLFFSNTAISTFNSLHVDDNLVGSAVVYISYNVISCVSLICALASQVKSQKEALLGGIIAGIGIALTGLTLSLPLYKHFNTIVGEDLPIFALAYNQSNVITTGYAVLLVLAILTTAVSSCYGVVGCFKCSNKLERLLFICLLSLTALVLSRIGFKGIVGRMYYIFGCLGLIQLCVIVSLKFD